MDLARSLLTERPNTYALVVSHENVTQNWYWGSDRSMLLPNCIFRAGGAALLLTGKTSEVRWVVMAVHVSGKGLSSQVTC